MLLFLFLACDGEPAKDSDTSVVTDDSVSEDSKDSPADDSTTTDDSGGDSDTDEPPALWAFTDAASVQAVVEPTVAPVYLAGLVRYWVQAGGEGPGCPAAIDRGNGTVELDATACATGSIGGKIVVSGLPAANQIPDGTPFVMDFQSFASVFGLYPVTGATGAMTVTFNGYDPSIHTDSFEANFAGPSSLFPQGSPDWGGSYRFEDYDASEGIVDFELTGLASGFVYNPVYGRASVDVTYKYGSGSCSETSYYPGTGTWVGTDTLTVTWDGNTDCDACIPYSLAAGGAGEICGTVN